MQKQNTQDLYLGQLQVLRNHMHVDSIRVMLLKNGVSKNLVTCFCEFYSEHVGKLLMHTHITGKELTQLPKICVLDRFRKQDLFKLNHYLNPVHIMCRLLDAELSCELVKAFCNNLDHFIKHFVHKVFKERVEDDMTDFKTCVNG